MRDDRIVVIGGGTGIYTVLMGLKRHSRNVTAVVTMADDGGSSGRLRDEFGHLPPGDTRRCLVALSANRRVNRVLRELFEYRFDRGNGLNGHSFGNLFLTALAELTGSMEQAIEEAGRLLNIRGRVLPVTTDNVRLCAELEDGTLIRGEHNIDVRRTKPDMRIKRVFLTPEASVYPPVADAILGARILVIGPGDLYTSLVPNLLVRGVPEAVQACRGTRIYVCNLMTKHGESDGFAASDFVAEILSYLGSPSALDCVITNTGAFAQEVLDKYAREKAYPVQSDTEKCLKLVPRVIEAALVSRGGLARHDATRLASLVLQAGRTMGRGPIPPAQQPGHLLEAMAAEAMPGA